ncbi:Rv1733c family protein [Streptomyces sp. NPDC002536]
MNLRGRHSAPGSGPAGHGPGGGEDTLWRPSDRLQARLNACLTALLLLALPTAAPAVGRAVYDAQLHTVRAQAADRHQVTGRLTAHPQGTPQSLSVTGVRLDDAPVSWTDAAGRKHTSTAKVATGTPTGASVRIWVDRSGSVTDPPMPVESAVLTGWVAGGMTASALIVLSLGARAAVAALLDRRRYAQWEAEWTELEPKWSRGPSS